MINRVFLEYELYFLLDQYINHLYSPEDALIVRNIYRDDVYYSFAQPVQYLQVLLSSNYKVLDMQPQGSKYPYIFGAQLSLASAYMPTYFFFQRLSRLNHSTISKLSNVSKPKIPSISPKFQLIYF